MKLYLLRHGATKGNIEKRYVGSTDEELLPEAELELQKRNLPKADKVFVSPLKRCKQTADIFYPGQEQIVIEEFRECDFGEFEYYNYKELNGNAAYQHFIDTMGMGGFPGGEDRDTFRGRCVAGFERIMSEENNRSLDVIAMVVHGGTIMALLDWYSVPHRDYYDWQAGNGTGYMAEVVKHGETGEWNFVGIHEIEG